MCLIVSLYEYYMVASAIGEEKFGICEFLTFTLGAEIRFPLSSLGPRAFLTWIKQMSGTPKVASRSRWSYDSMME